MKGYFVSRNMGWDCQGIQVEYEVERGKGMENNLCQAERKNNREAGFYLSDGPNGNEKKRILEDVP